MGGSHLVEHGVGETSFLGIDLVVEERADGIQLINAAAQDILWEMRRGTLVHA